MSYLALLFLVAGLLLVFRDRLKPLRFTLSFKDKKCIAKFEKDNTPLLRQLLINNFIVYRLLDEPGRRLFEKRVCKFIGLKDFRAGKSIPEITDEMKVMVAASAIQITFGYPGVYFNHFKTIILFAEEYYSTITGHYHEGEVNAGGAIVLSWKNFISGFSNMTDGKNLALHEMAHALRLTHIIENEEYDFFDRETMQKYEHEAHLEMQILRRGESSFFRSYGSVNQEEFFSVAVECFFEQPHQFRDYNPVLYELLSRILKIDLLNFEMV